MHFQIYELVNELFVKNKQLHKYMDEDFELNGWLSRVTDEYAFTSPWYIDVSDFVPFLPLNKLFLLSAKIEFQCLKFCILEVILNLKL